MTALLLSALVAVVPAALAQTVNRWVDDEGVTHFSDQKPVGDDADVREIEIPDASITEFESQDVNQRLNNLLQQMEQDRVAREQEIEAGKRARDAARVLEREPMVVDEKKKKDRDRSYDGPYPRPPPGPFPEKFPRLPGINKPVNPNNPVNQSN